MSLVRAELRRLAKRRVTRWMLVLVLALMAVVMVTAAVTHYQPGPEALARAEAEAQRAFEEQQQWVDRDVALCEQAHAAGDVDDTGWPEDCEEIRTWQSSAEEMVEWYMPPAFEFRESFREMISLFAGLMGLFAFVVGASFVGAEWRSGAMTNLLLWRPRRLQVLGTKLAALLAAVVGLGAVLGAVWTGGFWLVATFRGITDGMTAGVWQSLGLAGLRGLALVAAAGTVGFALASLGRHTAMAMGTAIAAFVVGVAGVTMITAGMLQVPFWETWVWTTYIRAWIRGSLTLHDWSAPCETFGPSGECITPTMEISWQASGAGIGIAVAVVLLAAMWQMRRRDVT